MGNKDNLSNEIKIIKCKRCNCDIEYVPKGWARKYCDRCRKIVDSESSQRYYKLNPEKIASKKERLKNNPLSAKMKCALCNQTMDRTVYNKKYCEPCKKKISSMRSSKWAKKYPEKKKFTDSLRDIEKRREGQRKYRKKNIKNYKIKDGLKYLNSAETRRKQARDYHKLHKDEIKITKIKYRKNPKNKSRLSFLSNKRRVRKKQMQHEFTLDEWNERLRETKGICPGCKINVGIENLTMDHILPISKASPGQKYSIIMVQPLCKSCNSKKYNQFGKGEIMKMVMGLADNNEDEVKIIIGELHKFIEQFNNEGK